MSGLIGTSVIGTVPLHSHEVNALVETIEPLLAQGAPLKARVASEARLLATIRYIEREKVMYQKLLHRFAEVRTDPDCAVCGGSGCEPDASTCSCYGWHAREAADVSRPTQTPSE